MKARTGTFERPQTTTKENITRLTRIILTDGQPCLEPYDIAKKLAEELNQWTSITLSTLNLEKIDKDLPIVWKGQHVCICDIMDIMAQGCKCGGA